jgi:hypothetical protein
MEHVDLIAAEFRNAGFRVRVHGIHVQPTLNRRVTRHEVESVVADYLDDGLVRVTRGSNGYWVSVNA